MYLFISGFFAPRGSAKKNGGRCGKTGVDRRKNGGRCRKMWEDGRKMWEDVGRLEADVGKMVGRR